jgi:hypothetical protein
MEYISAGEFTAKGKAYRSLKRNIPYYLVYLVLFIVVIIIMSLSESGR